MPISYRAAQNLIKRGDEPALRTALDDGLDPNLVNESGWSLLMLAAVEGSVSIGKLLLERGAIAAMQNAKGQTALAITTNRGYTTFAELLGEQSQS